MSSLDGYLDRVCGRLAVNPAVADEVREELRTHLEEAIGSASARGATREEAVAQALAGFGEVARVQAALQVVHSPEGVWLARREGPGGGGARGVSALIGAAPAGENGAGAPLRPGRPASGGGGRRGRVGRADRLLLPGARRRVRGLAAWLSGLAGRGHAEMDARQRRTARRRRRASLAALHSVLLAPLFGGCFGAAVAMSGSLLLRADLPATHLHLLGGVTPICGLRLTTGGADGTSSAEEQGTDADACAAGVG